jgi:predicted double-glycine peptidase
MRYQTRDYYCGPAAVQNAMFALGLKFSQDQLALLGGTSEADGTDEDGIKRMVLGIGREVDEFATDTDLAAFGWVWNNAVLGRPTVLCMDQWGHWVTVIGTLGKRVIMFDPARYRHNTDRLGTYNLPKDRFLRRWKAAHRTAGAKPAYYGIAIGDKLEAP